MKDKKFFVGLPASICTIIIIILALFEIELVYILTIIIFTSFAMISNIHFPKPGLKIDVIAGILIILTLIFGKEYHGIVPLVLITTFVTYAILGPLYLLKSK